MKKLLTIFLVLVAIAIPLTSQNRLLTLGIGGLASVAAPAVPTLVQMTTASNILTNVLGTTVNSCPTKAYCFSLPNNTQSGNAIIGCVTYSESPSATITVSDDKSNTYSIVDTADDTTNTKKVAMFVALNVASATRAITITSNVASAQVGVMASEFSNVATSSAVDVHNVGTSGSGSSTMATSAIVPAAQTGELLFQCGRRTQTKAGTFTAGSQSNITWQLVTADNFDGLVSQWGIYSSSASISPQLTMGSNSGYATVSAGFKTATSGAARPAGMQVVSVTHFNYIDGDLTGSTLTEQAPSIGNLIVVSSGWGGTPAGCLPTSITDTGSNSYSHLGNLGSTAGGRSDIFYAVNATPSNALTLTVNYASGGSSCNANMLVYDIIGAATSPFVQAMGFSDTNEPDASTYTLFDAPISPGVDSGISIWNHTQATSTTQTMSSPCTTVDIITGGGETIDGGADFWPDENQGWGHCNFATSAAQTNTIGFANTDQNAANYHVAFFKSPTAVAGNLVDDPFTHANAALGAAAMAGLYQIENGKNGFNIVSNGVQTDNFGSDNGNVWIGATFPANQWATCTLGTLTGTGSGNGVGLALRESTGAHTLYRIVVNATSGTNTFLGAFNAGSFTSLTSANSGSVWTSGDVLYVQVMTVSGDQVIKVRKGSGGSDIISYTDSRGANEITSGQPGLSYSSTMTAASCSAWTAGGL